MPTTDTPLRYPGGKTQMTPVVQDIMRVNGLTQAFYCEPFAGGAGIACRLLVSGFISEAWLNDIDPGIYAFWHSVLNEADDLCELIASTPVTMEEWRHQRELHQGARKLSTLRLGFATLFLNRTNRSSQELEPPQKPGRFTAWSTSTRPTSTKAPSCTPASTQRPTMPTWRAPCAPSTSPGC